MSKSLIYKNIYVYRFLMSLLYFGRYRRRFEKITQLLDLGDKEVVEFCFGDVYVASYCKVNGKVWTGYDLNDNFVKYACSLSYNAHQKDITDFESFPKCDVSIIIGSLYHFGDNASNMIKKMISSSKKVIISEPIINLSSREDVVGLIARKSTNTGKGHQEFRFNESSFLKMLNDLNVNYKVISIDKDILVVLEND